MLSKAVVRAKPAFDPISTPSADVSARTRHPLKPVPYGPMGCKLVGTVTELTLAKGVALLSRIVVLHGEVATVAMKKPLTMPDEPQPRNITRVDLVMSDGFGLEVDGRMKTVFPTLEAAQKRARDLKTEFPMLQVKVYDAAEKKLLELSPTE